jgi:molybdenum cofactor cytidylyltransferase
VVERAHVAVVLAGGGSRRLGRPKQWLRRDGETLLHRAVRLAQATEPQRCIVVLGAYHAELSESLRDVACEVLINPEWEQGLSSSLRCAALTVSLLDVRSLLLGCDQPELEREHLRDLLALSRASASACAATAHGVSVGIPAVVTPAVLRHAATLQGDRGLRDVLNAMPRDTLGVLDAPELGFDLDTLADLAAAQERGLIQSD